MNPIYIALICVGCVIVAALFVVFSNDCLCVTRHNITDPRIRDGGVKIVQISDLHGKRFGRGNRRLINKVKKIAPDMIVVTGDIIHKYRKRDIEVAEEAVKSVAAVAPVYYVSGNHEMRSKQYRGLREKLRENGAVILEDEAVSACGLNLVGVNCAHIKSGKFFGLADGAEGYKILLAHLPQYIDRYALAGYDLALCGHAHGGQWRIPFTGIGIYSPGQGLFPKYTAGVHSCGNMRQVISRGLGNSQCPLRLFNRPEIVVVNLKNQ